MIKIIAGSRGKGKTGVLLDLANEAITTANGSIVFIDKSSKHMYELNNKIRLIDTSHLPLKSSDQFLGAISGIISQDHDLEQIYLDNFIKLAKIKNYKDELEPCIHECENIGNIFDIDIIISVSVDKEDLSPDLQSKVTVAL